MTPVLLGLAGVVITGMVVVAMVLLTPGGSVEVPMEGADPEGSNLSPTPRPGSGPEHVPAVPRGT